VVTRSSKKKSIQYVDYSQTHQDLMKDYDMIRIFNQLLRDLKSPPQKIEKLSVFDVSKDDPLKMNENQFYGDSAFYDNGNVEYYDE
jgi:prophage DNA circulation protein